MGDLFTPEQIAFIDNIITKRLLESKARAKPNIQRSYHSVPEIRFLISANIERLKSDIGFKEFDLSVLRFFLKKYADLRSQDEEYLENAGCTRFDNQVSNAVRPEGWPDGNCPITSAKAMRKYQFSNFVAQSTLDLQ
jgi:hypothetical protein